MGFQSRPRDQRTVDHGFDTSRGPSSASSSQFHQATLACLARCSHFVHPSVCRTKMHPDCDVAYAAIRNLGTWCSLSCCCTFCPTPVEHLRDTEIVLLLIQISFVFFLNFLPHIVPLPISSACIYCHLPPAHFIPLRFVPNNLLPKRIHCDNDNDHYSSQLSVHLL